MATPEGRVKASIKNYLKSLPACWFYMPVQNGMGVVGIPDIMCCINGKTVAIECKAPGKEQDVTANQKNQIEGIRGAGGVAFVATSVEQTKTMLKLYGLA